MIKLLIFVICLTAQIWLWGHWSFDKSAGLSALLLLDSLLLFFLLGFPVYYFSKKKEFKSLFESKAFLSVFFVYVGLTLLLCMMSFYGLIQYLLPIKVLLLAVYGFLKFKKNRA